MINTNSTEKKLTGYPSIDKPWLKYYPEEAKDFPNNNATFYDCLFEMNKKHLKDLALIYFGRKINYGELFENVRRIRDALY